MVCLWFWSPWVWVGMVEIQAPACGQVPRGSGCRIRGEGIVRVLRQGLSLGGCWCVRKAKGFSLPAAVREHPRETGFPRQRKQSPFLREIWAVRGFLLWLQYSTDRKKFRFHRSFRPTSPRSIRGCWLGSKKDETGTMCHGESRYPAPSSPLPLVSSIFLTRVSLDRADGKGYPANISRATCGQFKDNLPSWVFKIDLPLPRTT